MKRSRLYILIVALCTLLAGCESIDCTLNNVVCLRIGFYASDSKEKVSVLDTLTITAEGTDSVLLNRGVKTSDVKLPMSYWQDEDVLRMTFTETLTRNKRSLVLRVGKTNTQHYEGPECPTVMFHNLKNVDFDDENGLVDSVVVTNKHVNYAPKENIQIYLHAAD